MQKKLLQFVFSILLIGGAFFAYSIQASQIILYTNPFDHYQIASGSFTFPSPTNFTGTGYISSLDVQARSQNLDFDCISGYMYATIFTSNGNQTSTNHVDYDTLTDQDSVYTFLFSTSTAMNLASSTVSQIGFTFTGTSSCSGPDANDARIGVDTSNALAFTLKGVGSTGITSPTEFSTIRQNSSVTVTGFCPHNGTDQISVVAVPNGQSIDDYNLDDLIYGVTCASNSFSASVSVGTNQQYCFYAIDESTHDISAATCVFANSSGTATGSSVGFNSPPFADNSFSGADFSTWLLFISLPPASGVTSYYYTVSYGASSTAFSYTDNLKTQVGLLSLSSNEQTNGLQQTNLPLNKLNATASSTIFALATLYDQNNATMATSSILTLNINALASTTYPSNIQLVTALKCPPSDFGFSLPSLSPVVSSPYFDIGQGLCQTSVFLLQPDQREIDRFPTLWSSIQNKPPFGYFTQSKNSLAEISTSTTAIYTLPNITGISFFRDLVDNALAFLVTLSFLVFLFHRFRLFNFHT